MCTAEEGNYELALTASFHALDAAMQKGIGITMMSNP